MTLMHHSQKAGRMPATLCTLIATASCTFALAACHSPETSQATAAKPASTASAVTFSQLGTAPQASPFTPNPAGAAALAAGADNYGKLLQRYPAAQQTKIKAWYASYAADSMSFRSNAQWQWMRQHDYPTPDDVLRASAMSQAQLRDLAAHDDTKANFFYLARLVDDYTQANVASTARSQNDTRLQAEMSASMNRALASGSAFTGYMYGAYYAALHGAKSAEIGRACGLMWAWSSGDGRVMSINQMAMGFPGVSGARIAETSFDMFAAAAHTNPYFLKARHGRGKLLIPLQ